MAEAAAAGALAEAAALPTSDPEPVRLPLLGGGVTVIDEGPKDAPALLAVHGVPGSVRDFRYLAPQITAAVRLVRIDLPGFGGSAAERQALRTLEGRVRVVLAVADHLGLARFSVLGHSMGGGTAILSAAAHPARVSHLVLLASLGVSMHRGLGMAPVLFRGLGEAMRVPGLRRALLPSMRTAYRRRRFPGVERMSTEDFSVQLLALSATDFGVVRRAVARPLPPTLYAYSCDDHMVETHVSDELAALLPATAARLDVIRFPEGGHNIQKTRAVEIGTAIRRLLRLE